MWKRLLTWKVRKMMLSWFVMLAAEQRYRTTSGKGRAYTLC